MKRLKKNTVGDIIGSFKSAATKAIHEAGHFVGRTIWQSRFYDHIIFDDVSFYFIQQYIQLNPLILGILAIQSERKEGIIGTVRKNSQTEI